MSPFLFKCKFMLANLLIYSNIIFAMNVMGHTITGAASGETVIYSAEGFTISGKRTEE